MKKALLIAALLLSACDNKPEKVVQVPLTNLELRQITDECNSYGLYTEVRLMCDGRGVAYAYCTYGKFEDKRSKAFRAQEKKLKPLPIIGGTPWYKAVEGIGGK